MLRISETWQKMNMAAATHVGSVRLENEDNYYFSQARQFFIVCDGMGAHEKGATASRFGCETIRDLLFAPGKLEDMSIHQKRFSVAKACQDISGGLPDVALKLIAGYRLANRRILAHAVANRRMQGMGTTILSTCFLQGHVLFAHVGDSRLYRLRDGALTCMTTDHSWLNELIEDNEISEKDARHFKNKNVLTRALGIATTVKIDLEILSIEQNDLYLVCTDGLYNALPDDLIASILKAHHGSLQHKVNNLVSRARVMDGSDNITAGLMYVASLSPKKIERLDAKLTAPDEHSAVSDYLDQMVKQLYPIKAAPRRLGKKTFGLTAAIAAIAVLFGLLLFHNSKAQKTPTLRESTALFSQRAAPHDISNVTQAPSKAAGYLVLVQVGDIKYVHALSELPSIRILDRVARLNSGAPLSSGTYTWALADADQNILYKNNGIDLAVLDEWYEVDPATLDTSQSGRKPDEFDGFTSSANNKARVFLVGDFNTPEYNGASIVIGNTMLGALNRFRDSGIELQGGVYDIKIVDSNQAVLREKSNVEIYHGETIAIEF